MSALMAVAALALGAAAARELLAERADPAAVARAIDRRAGALRPALATLDLRGRVSRAGMEGRLSIRRLVVLKLAGAAAGAVAGLAAAPAAPGRLAWVVAVGLPAAGFAGPDAWLERRARARLRRVSSALPAALELLAVGAAAGRIPGTALGELAPAGTPLGRELRIAAAEAAAGVPQREVIDGLRRRVPLPEVAAMCGAIDRSRTHGSPLADQLGDQAVALRASERRRTADRAARAAPKIQLVVALLLVPSVLLMIAAGLVVNLDSFLAGI